MEKYYSAPVTMPKNDKDGFFNRLQIIINLLENDNPREALLQAVDFQDALESYEIKQKKYDINISPVDFDEPVQVTAIVPQNDIILSENYYRNSY